MAKSYIHEIPEGYEARIEGNKVIIELIESEDERIRKWILDEFHLLCHRAAGDKERENCLIKAIAWLEKQKEQKPASTEDMPYIADEHFFEREPVDSFKYKLAEYMTKNYRKVEGPYGHTYAISAESILQMAKEELIKRGELKEQKPLSPDEKMNHPLYLEGFDVGREVGKVEAEQKPEQITDAEIKDSMDAVTNFKVFAADLAKTFNITHQRDIDWHNFCAGLLTYLERNKPAEWSKNDTVFLNEITDYFENKTVRLQHDIDMYAHWLKSLPERFNLQPKQEWSEEDEEMLEYIIGDVNDAKQLYKTQEAKDMANKEITWLKSLRPFWKPSEEQMKALRRAVNKLAKSDVADSVRLSIMYDNLKKLM